MTDAATLTRAAADLAAQVQQVAGTAQEAILICGLIAARIAAGSDQNEPANSPAALLNTLSGAFNAAMMIESGGRVSAPKRQHLGFQE